MKTTAFVCAYLDELGISYRKTEPTGVIAEIKGAASGKTVALRGDMDALSVEQLNTHVPYASKIEGKMHACGHDAHTSMLLIAAKALSDVKDELPGNVRLLFQPAEEIAQGAKAMVDQGAMDGVDNVFGIHIWSQIPTHKVSCPPGPSFAAADIFKVHFTGKGGHGAIPQDCIDAALVASSFVMNVQTVVSRTIDPQQAAVLTVGKMEVGTRFNIIAENALIEGTVRTFNQDTAIILKKAFHNTPKASLTCMARLQKLNISAEQSRLLTTKRAQTLFNKLQLKHSVQMLCLMKNQRWAPKISRSSSTKHLAVLHLLEVAIPRKIRSGHITMATSISMKTRSLPEQNYMHSMHGLI